MSMHMQHYDGDVGEDTNAHFDVDVYVDVDAGVDVDVDADAVVHVAEYVS